MSDLTSKRLMSVRGTRVGLKEGLVNAVRSPEASIYLQVMDADYVQQNDFTKSAK